MTHEESWYAFIDELRTYVQEHHHFPNKHTNLLSNLAKACRFFGAKWKYDLVFRENYFLTFFRRGWASFRGRHLKNSRNVWAN